MEINKIMEPFRIKFRIEFTLITLERLMLDHKKINAYRAYHIRANN